MPGAERRRTQLDLFIKGLVIGFAIAAPVGPIGLLCIRRTIAGGHLHGFISGLGAAGADALYGAVAVFGLTLVSEFLIDHVRGLSLAGGLFLLYLGASEWRSRPPDPSTPGSVDVSGLAHDFTSTFVLTLANPMTVLSFFAIFTGLGIVSPAGEFAASEGGYGPLAVLVIGVFLGSAAWWLTLSSGVGLVRHHIDVTAMMWLNRIAGTLVIGFGLYALWFAFR
jgi:threonine/homoserine/homoserine lactone efflux protein